MLTSGQLLADRYRLARRIAVGIRTAADQIGASFACRQQQLFGAGIVEQTLLREHADFKLDCPGIIAFEPLHRLECAKSNARVDLGMRAHAHGAMRDCLFQGPSRAGINVRFGEGALCCGDFADGMLEASLFR